VKGKLPKDVKEALEFHKQGRKGRDRVFEEVESIVQQFFKQSAPQCFKKQLKGHEKGMKHNTKNGRESLNFYYFFCR